MGVRLGLSDGEHDSLVRAIYDHVADDDMETMIAAWPTAFRSYACHLMVIDPRVGVVESCHPGEMRGDVEEYETHWLQHDPRIELSRHKVGSVLSDVLHIDAKQFERSEIYNEVLRPFGVRYSMFGYAPLANGLLLAQSLMRGPDAAYDQQDIAAMERLWPHLQRGLDLRFELRDLRRRIAGFSTALDHVTAPIYLIDAQQRVVHYNTAAADQLAKGALRLNRQQLTAPTAASTATLRAAIMSAVGFADVDTATRGEPVTATIRVDRVHGRSLDLVVHPLRPRSREGLAASSDIRALVVVHDPDAHHRVDPALIARLHGLTPTEAALAASLAEGKTLIEFAAARGCAESTARTHLKRVLEKMAVRRQAELVQKVLLGTALPLS